MDVNNYHYINPLRRRIETELLPFIIKPGRYVGNELNSIRKDHQGLLKVALVFPDIYEIGMSYLGMQILYNIINKRDDCVAERAFQVWPDMESLMRQQQIPLFSLETSTPLEDFDVIGISVTYEMHAGGILNILDLAGLPFRAKDRDDSYPLVIGGGPAIVNPEPFAEFFDVMVIGDGEEIATEIVDCLQANKDQSKEAKLKALAQVKGVYIPSFYEPEYEHGQFKVIKPISDDIPESIKIRSCMDLKKDYYPAKPIVPFIETTHDRLAIEIMRGCVNGCRFCQAGYQYRPQRPRKSAEIYSQIQSGYWATGYEDVTLLSLSSTDYPDLETLVTGIMPFLNQHKISLSLPSIRPGSLSSTMLDYLKQQRKSGITFAPEAGTQRLRDVMGKNITAEEIIDGIKKVFDNDWTLVKLYFMIGLPGETVEDIEGIINTIKDASTVARSKGGKKNINVTISPFAPKPGTPWQWEAQFNHEKVYETFEKINQAVRSRNVTLKLHDPRLATVEGILGRGDRRLADVIEAAYRKGARMDGWSEYFDYTRWEQAFADCGMKLDNLLDVRFIHQTLPWEHIDKGISKKFLLDERDRSFKGELPPGAAERKDRNANKNNMEFGRKAKKRIIASAAPTKSKVRIKYTRDNNLRFYSHLDMIRLFNRAIRRAGLPVSFSQGYHPHMKLSFGPPLPIGYSSDAEYLDIQLDSPFEKGYLAKFNDSLPPGIMITMTRLIYSNVESLTKIINCATYLVDIPDQDDDISAKIDSLMDSSSLIIKRMKNEEIKEVEVRPLIHELSYTNNQLNLLLGFAPDVYVRPAEILVHGLGMDERLVQALIFRRAGQYMLQGIHKVEPMDLV